MRATSSFSRLDEYRQDLVLRFSDADNEFLAYSKEDIAALMDLQKTMSDQLSSYVDHESPRSVTANSLDSIPESSVCSLEQSDFSAVEIEYQSQLSDIETEKRYIEDTLQRLATVETEIPAPKSESTTLVSEEEAASQFQEEKKYQIENETQRLIQNQLRYKLDKLNGRHQLLSGKVRQDRQALLGLYQHIDQVKSQLNAYPRDLGKERKRMKLVFQECARFQREQESKQAALRQELGELSLKRSEAKSRIEHAATLLLGVKNEITAIETETSIAACVVSNLQARNVELKELNSKQCAERDLIRNAEATKIQATWRAFLGRRLYSDIQKSLRIIQRNWKRAIFVKRLNAALSSQKQNRKAAKIQALYKGYRTRKLVSELKFSLKQGDSDNEDLATMGLMPDNDDDDFEDMMNYFDENQDLHLRLATPCPEPETPPPRIVANTIQSITEEWGFQNPVTAALALKKKKRMLKMEHKSADCKLKQGSFQVARKDSFLPCIPHSPVVSVTSSSNEQRRPSMERSVMKTTQVKLPTI